MNWLKGKNKYKAEATDGFPSKLEKAVHDLLLLRQRAKEIKDIKRQVRVTLTAGIASKIDFSFLEIETNETVYCEAKGMSTERWTMIKKLWRSYGPSKLEIWGGTYKRPRLMEIIRTGGGADLGE